MEKETQKEPQITLNVEVDDDDNDEPAGIGGSEFFGGNKEKEEFYDETAERQITLTAKPAKTYNRFENRQAFANDAVANLALQLQGTLNQLLYCSDDATSELSSSRLSYAKNFEWISPLTTKSSGSNGSTTPLTELQDAMGFYKHVDLAIVSGQQQQNNKNGYEFQWELSVAWPTFWTPRILVLGSSTIVLDNVDSSAADKNIKIIKQVDKVVDNGDLLLRTLLPQILPRFWDIYHIGMTPSSEMSPQLNRQEPGFFGINYQVYDLPARWKIRSTRLETGTRQDGNAQFLPSHVFTSFIKTMGPTRDRYVPTTGTSVEIKLQATSSSGGAEEDTNQQLLEWHVPMSVEAQAQLQWPIPGEDPETNPNTQPTCDYVLEPRKKVATVNFAGLAQDAEISQIRKDLYNQVLKDGFKPKMDLDTGRPKFFFLSGTTKACFTRQGGLGMAVYEWRPKFANSNQVGLELEMPQEAKAMITSTITNVIQGQE